METIEASLQSFTDALASKQATPGGGGACALVGALACALGSMVGNLTVGKQKYADVEAEIKACLDRAETLRRELLSCIERDAEAFLPLSRAYAIPKDDPAREKTMETCLRAAVEPPLTMMELCAEVIGLLEVFGEKGSALALSDAATGAALCKGALLGAMTNVRVNTRLMRDRTYAELIDDEANDLLTRYGARADKVYEAVMEKLK